MEEGEEEKRIVTVRNGYIEERKTKWEKGIIGQI